MVRWVGGSRWIRQTVFPSSASAAPRFTVVVVFPTPPFWFINAMMRGERVDFGCAGVVVETGIVVMVAPPCAVAGADELSLISSAKQAVLDLPNHSAGACFLPK